MKSAYLVLGVPGNASLQDIESAFEHASALYAPKRIASEEGAAAKLDEIRTAYQVLRDPSSREAHDRKLAGALKPQPQVRVIYQEASPSGGGGAYPGTARRDGSAQARGGRQAAHPGDVPAALSPLRLLIPGASDRLRSL